MAELKIGCFICLYWSPGTGIYGECHRRSPIINPEDNGETLWPTTYQQDWCGDFLRKEEEDE